MMVDIDLDSAIKKVFGGKMHKTILAMILILISCVFVYAIQKETDWIKFTTPEGRFSLLLPHEPKLEVVSDPADAKLTHNRFSEFEDGYAFIIEYFDNVSITDPEKYLDSASRGIVDAIKGTLVRESKTTLEGYPGRELELSLTSSNGTAVSGRTRIYAVGSSFYSMSYVWRKDIDAARASEIGEKYFSSAKLTPSK